jgi:hypothetical protein
MVPRPSLRVPPSFAECAAMLAFGDELLVLPDCQTTSTSGARRAVATWRPPTCCRAPRPRCARTCSGWPTPPRERAKASPRAACARCDAARDCWRAKARTGWIGRAQPRAARARCVGPRGRRERSECWIAISLSHLRRHQRTSPRCAAAQAGRCTTRGLLQRAGNAEPRLCGRRGSLLPAQQLGTALGRWLLLAAAAARCCCSLLPRRASGLLLAAAAARERWPSSAGGRLGGGRRASCGRGETAPQKREGSRALA